MILEQEPLPVRVLKSEIASGCGSATIRMALAAYGIIIAEKKLAKILHTTPRKGTSLDDMRSLIWTKGLFTLEYSGMTWNELRVLRKNYPAPMIVAWWDDRESNPASHYSLVKSVTPKEVTIHDPYYGEDIAFSRYYWLRHWKDFPKQRTDRRWLMLVLSKQFINYRQK